MKSNSKTVKSTSGGNRAIFWKKLLRLTRGRVTLVRALTVIASEETDAPFRAVLLDLKRMVDEGSPPSDENALVRSYA